MSEHPTPQATPTAGRRSRKLTAVVLILGLLPLVLPVPLVGLAHLWIAPVIAAKIQACASFYCPPADDWARLSYLVILGPSLLVAVASLLLGSIGLFRSRQHPTSPANTSLFAASMCCGAVWVGIFGCLLWVSLTILALTTTE